MAAGKRRGAKVGKRVPYAKAKAMADKRRRGKSDSGYAGTGDVAWELGKRIGGAIRGKAKKSRAAARSKAMTPATKKTQRKYSIEVGKPRGTGVTVGKPKIHKKVGAKKRPAVAKKTMPRRKTRGKKG